MPDADVSALCPCMEILPLDPPLGRCLQAAGQGELDHPLPPEGGVPGQGFKARNKFLRILSTDVAPRCSTIKVTRASPLSGRYFPKAGTMQLKSL
jgi:hypothetical protein